MITTETIEPSLRARVRDEQGITLLFLKVIHLKRHGGKIEAVIHKDEGVTHKDCGTVTRLIKDGIAEAGGDGDDYTITVSSPGTDYVFRQDDDYTVFTGHPVKLTLTDEGEAAFDVREMIGVLDDYANDTAVVAINDDTVVDVPRAQIAKARLFYPDE